VKQLAGRRGFAWLATREVFSKGDPRPYYADGSHWSAAGHALMSEALLEQSLAILKRPCKG
jgi:lysophospholipase L1-like esterase